MVLKAFEKYISELMYSEAYFTSNGKKTVCHFNNFRSRQKYLLFCGNLAQQVWQELQQTSDCPHHRQYISLRLQEAGKLFVVENDTVVSHRHLVAFVNGTAVSPSSLDEPSRFLLSAYLCLQHSAWQALCRLCETIFSVYRSCYLWLGNEIDLLELADALWATGFVQVSANDRSKKKYFCHLLAFFNLPVPADPCRRLGELTARKRPDSFLAALQEKYRDYWKEREK